MRRWRPNHFALLSQSHARLKQPRQLIRAFASASDSLHLEHVPVPCRSSGNITVDLYNISRHPPRAPLLIYIPPFSGPAHLSPPLPSFISQHPTAVINYRWPEDAEDEQTTPPGPSFDQQLEPFAVLSADTPLHWPTPLHDTLFGYEWILENLAPGRLARRDVYVVGSYLGASLAASLALTESHPHKSMAVRGVALYNGIYNWTAFLPNHSVNQPRTDISHGNVLGTIAALVNEMAQKADAQEYDDGFALACIKQLIPNLFKTPGNLFDPFASPSLFFRTAAMFVPPNFEPPVPGRSPALQRAIAELSLDPKSVPKSGSPEAATLEAAFQPPRTGYLVYPPRKSTLRIPETLLLHQTSARIQWQGGGKKTRLPRLSHWIRSPTYNGFASQAIELAKLMRRSVAMYELKDRMRWDQDIEDPSGEAERRIQVSYVKSDEQEDAVGKVIGTWLEKQVENRL